MFNEIVNGGKLDLVDDLFHPDFKSRTPQGDLDREGFKAYVAAWRAAFPDVHCEVTFETHGTLLDIETNEVGTYEAIVRPDGTLFGEGQGVLSSPQGDMATWRGQGAGRLDASGGTEFRGAIYFETASPRWAGLNGIAGVYEYSADASGKTETSLWEWR